MRVSCALGLAALLSSTVCAGGRSPEKAERGPAEKAVAVLSPLAGSPVAGRVEFALKKEGYVLVRTQINGLQLGSRHGFHIHEYGDCSSPDGMSAGEHF